MRSTVYIRKANWKRWRKIKNKSDWVNARLACTCPRKEKKDYNEPHFPSHARFCFCPDCMGRSVVPDVRCPVHGKKNNPSKL